MGRGQAGGPDREVIVCADVLGSFGVTPADIRAQRREYRDAVPPGREADDAALEAMIADVLDHASDRTATVRRTICRSDRGLTCSARYAQTALGRELEGVFETIGWSFEWTRTGPAENGRDRLELAATDPKGRRREVTVTYPATPLADDNLPAVLYAVDERLLAGTGATIVLLSAGVDRWRAALVEAAELAELRERYGPRISAFDRPLLPDHSLEAYFPEDGTDDSDDSSGAGESTAADAAAVDESGPWPTWALERAERRANGPIATRDDSAEPRPDSSGSDSLIEEAEPDADDETAEASESSDASVPADSRQSAGASEPSPSATSEPATAVDGFEIRGGSPTVSRAGEDGDSRSGDPVSVETGRDADERRSGPDDEGDSSDEDDSEWTLSGPQKTARVGNDAFGTDAAFETEDDRYLAVGAALGAGGRVTVEGLLEDDEFLPELPAVEPDQTRIEFAESFDPDAFETAKATAEEEGFEWVDSGSLETKRVSTD